MYVYPTFYYLSVWYCKWLEEWGNITTGLYYKLDFCIVSNKTVYESRLETTLYMQTSFQSPDLLHNTFPPVHIQVTKRKLTCDYPHPNCNIVGTFTQKLPFFLTIDLNILNLWKSSSESSSKLVKRGEACWVFCPSSSLSNLCPSWLIAAVLLPFHCSRK